MIFSSAQNKFWWLPRRYPQGKDSFEQFWPLDLQTNPTPAQILFSRFSRKRFVWTLSAPNQPEPAQMLFSSAQNKFCGLLKEKTHFHTFGWSLPKYFAAPQNKFRGLSSVYPEGKDSFGHFRPLGLQTNPEPAQMLFSSLENRFWGCPGLHSQGKTNQVLRVPWFASCGPTPKPAQMLFGLGGKGFWATPNNGIPTCRGEGHIWHKQQSKSYFYSIEKCSSAKSASFIIIVASPFAKPSGAHSRPFARAAPEHMNMLLTKLLHMGF